MRANIPLQIYIDTNSRFTSDKCCWLLLKARKYTNFYKIYLDTYSGFISDKCCGLLLRARKYKLLTFQGEMLFQVIIHFVRLLLALALMSEAWRWISSTLFRVKTTSLWSRCWGRNKKSKHNSRSPATIKWMNLSALLMLDSCQFVHIFCWQETGSLAPT